MRYVLNAIGLVIVTCPAVGFASGWSAAGAGAWTITSLLLMAGAVAANRLDPDQ